MPSPKNTFYLLEPLEVLQHPEQWLGRIVKDYRRLREGAIPRTPATFVAGIDDDHFADVDALISATHSTAFGANLVELLGSKYERSRKDGRGVKAQEVHRIRLQEPEDVLGRLQRDPGVSAKLDEWPSSKPFSPPVCFVVGFLVARDPVLSHEAGVSQTVGGNVDPVGIAAAAAGGVPLPIQGAEGSVEHTHSHEGQVGATAPGIRILAMEYKILHKRLQSTAIENEGYGPQGAATFAGELRVGSACDGTLVLPVEVDSGPGFEPETRGPEVEDKAMFEDFEWMADSRFGLAKVAESTFVFQSDGFDPSNPAASTEASTR